MGMTQGSSSNAMEIPDGIMKPKPTVDPMNPYKKAAKGALGGLAQGLDQYQNQNQFFGGQ